MGDPAVGPYDGADDTLVGVVNNSRTSVPAITVKGPGTGLSLFDGDGLCTFAAGSCPNGPTGYEGPGTTLVTDPSLPDAAEVDFSGAGLAPQATSYFSLEGVLSSAQITAARGTLIPKGVSLVLKTSATVVPFDPGQDPGVAAYVRYTLTATYSNGMPAANAAVNLSNAAPGVTFHTNSLGVLSLLEPVSVDKKLDLTISAAVAAPNGSRAAATQQVYSAVANVRCNYAGYPRPDLSLLEGAIGDPYLAEIQDIIDFLTTTLSRVTTTITGFEITVPGSPSIYAMDVEVRSTTQNTQVYEDTSYASHEMVTMPSPLDNLNAGYSCGVPA
ncbi:hypothetical protein [Arthrobacter sp. 135MFCol5.1]|uniref:hypothetical protein n=1 Tax=Arthrobacter sp. 135MFCol5.1 TaxID=1158050 RepID=UPI00037CA430|nr:hypothetical protein [Arthrobacter sp. 135MFCol5.1]